MVRAGPFTKICARFFASPIMRRTSATPPVTAEKFSKCALVKFAHNRAKVVFPVPAGPKKRQDGKRSASSMARSGAPFPTRCFCPAYSSKVRGRKRAASGAFMETGVLRLAEGSSFSGKSDIKRKLTRKRFVARRSSDGLNGGSLFEAVSPVRASYVSRSL